MRYSIRIGRSFQTRIRVHYSWVLAVILITFAVTTQFSTDYPFWLRIASGIGASLLFFTAIGIRELVIILVATYKGIDVESVTFFAFGGLLEVDSKTTSPAHESMLSLTGMLGNLIITGIFYISYIFLPETVPIMVNVIIKWLAFLCFTLTLFHIVPGYPLEGGRIFRAILWKVLNNGRRATQIASWVSWVLGIGIVIAGILMLVFTIERFTGVFLVAIGLILQNAATHSRRQLYTLEAQIPVDTLEPENI